MRRYAIQKALIREMDNVFLSVKQVCLNLINNPCDNYETTLFPYVYLVNTHALAISIQKCTSICEDTFSIKHNLSSL